LVLRSLKRGGLGERALGLCRRRDTRNDLKKNIGGWVFVSGIEGGGADLVKRGRADNTYCK